MENCVKYKYLKIRLESWKTNKHTVSAFFYIYIYTHVCFIIFNMSNFV